jgi:guanylate kinase
MQVLGGMPKGLIFIVSAPAGTGKTTLVHMLQKEFSCVAQSISYTTRPMRVSEIADQDYHFLGRDEFEEKIKAGDFLEHARVFGDYYGTSRNALFSQLSQGKHVMLVIDTQGALQLRGKLDAVFIFIQPPSLDVLKKRLLSRKSESSAAMEERLAWAQKEIDCAIYYDYQIVNDDLKTAYDVLRSVLIAEEHKNRI